MFVDLLPSMDCFGGSGKAEAEGGGGGGAARSVGGGGGMRGGCALALYMSCSSISSLGEESIGAYGAWFGGEGMPCCGAE